MSDYYIYPAVLSMDPDGVAVEFPDLPGGLTCGRPAEEAIAMAREAMALHLYGMEKDGEPIPDPSPVPDLKLEKNQAVVLVEASMPLFRDKMMNRAVKKTLTIPKWLNDLATANQINFSRVLQEALKRRLGIAEPGEGKGDSGD